MSSSNIALFDMDGSLVDYAGQLRCDLELLRAPSEPAIVNLWDEDKQPHMAARIRLIKSQPGWWYNLLPIPQGMLIFNAAQKMGFDCHILTKGPKKHTHAWSEKVNWCYKHLGEVAVHITSDKGLIYGKFLYDDWPDYCSSWLAHRRHGLVIMPVTDYNKSFSHPQVVKWTGENLDEVIAAMEVCLKRQVGEPLVL